MRPAHDIEPQEPNVAPLIDIVFILLIFFVVTTTFARDLGIDVNRPQAKSGTEVTHPVTRVAVGARRELAVDGRATSSWRLEAELKERLLHSTHKSVVVVSDGSVDAKTLVEVMDAARLAGAQQIALSVEQAP